MNDDLARVRLWEAVLVIVLLLLAAGVVGALDYSDAALLAGAGR
jgi:archaellum component FlaG (FlaF/FlaG flagellin family)